MRYRVITNIQEDHLGLNDIHLEGLSRVKSVVVDSVKPDGWAVLNAEDENCVKIGNSLRCNVAYFSLNEDCPVIKEHYAEDGGVAAIYENGFTKALKRGDWKIRIGKCNF